MKKEDNLLAWKVFRSAVETGNLTHTSIALDIDPAAASRLLDGLEESLGTTLLYRNRRPFIASSDGDEIYNDVCQMLDMQQKIINRFSALPKRVGAQRHQVIRLSAAQGYGHGWLMPRLLEYMKIHPEVSFDTLIERNLRDLAEDRIEVLLSVHRFVRQGFVIKPYAILPCVAFASPRYVERYGMPNKPEDLWAHIGLIRSGINFPISRDMATDGVDTKPMTWGKEIKAENSIVLKRLAIDGEGIVFDLPIGFFVEELQQKQLIPVMKGWHRTPFYCAVVTTDKLYKSSQKIHTFVDWLVVAEGRASNDRTLAALAAMGMTVEQAFFNPTEFHEPIQAYFNRRE